MLSKKFEDKLYTSWKKNREYKLKVLEDLDKLIKLAMPNKMRENLVELRKNSHWYTAEQIEKKMFEIYF